jgi:hypothetical protein
LQPGDRIPPAVAGCCRQLVVERGTVMVAPLAGFAICVTGGFNATFVVTGDPEAVVRGYALQFEAAEFDGGIEHRADRGASIVDARYTSAGAGDLRATATQRAGRPTYLELRTATTDSGAIRCGIADFLVIQCPERALKYRKTGASARDLR